jgi:enoyl-CoA hydratase/carnithine racemase
MAQRPIRLAVQGGVALITIARAEHRNALDDVAIDALADCLRALESPGVRAAVITGAGERSFCAGYDIACIDPDQDPAAPLPDDRFAVATQAVLDSPVPVVAAIRGGAWGGGLDLALACDLRVCHPEALLAMTPCRLGLIYRAEGLQRFSARVGVQATRRLFLTADPVQGPEALRLGLVDVLDSDPLGRARSWAQSVARNAPFAVAGVRQALAALERDPSLSDPAVRERLLRQRRAAFASGDLRRGLAAALERKPPSFEGD